MRWHLVLTASVALTACGGSDDDDDSGAFLSDSCGLRADVMGGAALRFSGNDDAACLTQHSFDTGLDVAFIGVNANGSLEFAIDGVAEGETGADFPTRVLVTNPAKERWQGSGCVTTLTEHRLVETEASEIGELRRYQVDGEGTCSEPLPSFPEGADPVTIDAFTFRAQVTWRD